MTPLPFAPPLPPMLARLARALPEGDYAYEPKWDGFRCIAFASGGAVDLRSRHERPLARYFPELVSALAALPRPAVIDGEIVASGPGGPAFGALLARLHPSASRVARLARETPASLFAFDLLADGGEDLRVRAFAERRTRLEALLAAVPPPLHLTPSTASVDVARTWLERFHGAGTDGVIAKRRDLPYAPGRRAMVKVKRERTAECVVAGLRTFAGEPVLASMLLGLWDGAGALRHVGVASSFPEAERRALFAGLAPLAVPLAGHPWEHGFNVGHSPTGRLAGSAGRWDPREMDMDWMPLAPVRVVEIAYDRLDALRFRHPGRFVRWRPDRDARSCALDQLAIPLPELDLARGAGP
ncbi:MAG TPA: ATP-dependent DNA ligase [Anaeromyxobacter sp.]|nr:ATP-dependent DNA ligase [Anaeromyxobacter sp.]